MPARPVRRLFAFLGRALIVIVAVAAAIVAVAVAAVETGWGKNQLRMLIVRQANRYLTAQLEIGSLSGSLFRDIELGGIRLTRDGRPIITVDSVSLAYSPRELWQQGVVIRQLRLVRPYVAAGRGPDGRWDLPSLVRRETTQQARTGPGGAIEISSIEVVDGTVRLLTPVTFGAVRIPTEYDSLNVVCSFAYHPVEWRLDFTRASWRGRAPALDMDRLAGGLSNGPGGFRFRDFSIRTPRTTVKVDGRIDHERDPTAIDLRVDADRFAFQEWSGILHGLTNIAIDSSFTTELHGPVTALATDLRLDSNGGAVAGRLTLNTRVPGWRGAGAVDVRRLNLARWRNRPDRISDITGRVTFNLALQLGTHFPSGTYSFIGPHAGFMDYGADNVRATGTLTQSEAVIASATARAYGADVTIGAGSIGLDDPFPFRFRGRAAGVDLRALPKAVPVPHVESVLAFDYDVNGRFVEAFIAGQARFAPSTFVGATIGDGTVGTIDTSATPLRYTGDGEVDGMDLHRLGDRLEIAWLTDPRYRGAVSGRFRVEGTGSDRESMTLDASGRMTRATLFGGTLGAADVSLRIAGGSLETRYDGAFDRIDPAIPLDDPRFASTLTGRADVAVTVRDLLTRTPAIDDYDVDGTMTLTGSVVRGFAIDRLAADAAFRNAAAAIRSVAVAGPAVEGSGSGTIAFADGQPSQFEYSIRRAQLKDLQSLTGRELGGTASTSGHLSGDIRSPRLAGHVAVEQLAASGVEALTTDGDYDVTLSPKGLADAAGRVTAQLGFANVLGVALDKVTASAQIARGELAVDLSGAGRRGTFDGRIAVDPARQTVRAETATVSFGTVRWQLTADGASPVISWSDEGVTVAPMSFAAPTAGQRIEVGGTWRTDGTGALHVAARHVYLDTVSGMFEQPARYGGVVDGEATISGTRSVPIVTGDFTITSGRVRRLSYDQFAAHVDYRDSMFDVRARLDQAPSVWLTADGTVPLALFTHATPARPISLTVKSAPIPLGLVEGVTDVIRSVSGTVQLDARVIGTSADPHFAGTVDAANAAFVVAATGATYQHGRVSLQLAPDRLTIASLHLEDRSGNPLEVSGSLGTHELRVGSLAIDVTGRHFTVMRNELGTAAVDARLTIRGRAEAPTIAGDVTIQSGTLKVDEIMDRVLFRPYSTTPAGVAPELPTALDVDPLAALNPWDRLALQIALHIPENLRLTGENVQVSPGTPLGLGNIDLRAGGDLWLLKEAGQALAVYGSLDSITGSYGFQGRRFTIVGDSSINFRGSFSPELYVNVNRVISGVDTRVSVIGPFDAPELRLSSTPPLPQSDILSLIVFNASSSDLSAAQQQELAIRAGALAAGFFATPLVSALESTLGLSELEVEPGGEFGVITGPKVTIGEEIAPGLVARFTRQFGANEYNQATVEYYLSRILQIRATFSDASSLTLRSPFVRVERAGIDLLLFFSF